ncbi:hypothetical protein BX666DRAFT_1975970 [Dichotomocladium elegans]|nr:hypothetical protein BX666DRAFT_1975970 [Dichotomocladium elegans]
MDAIAGHGHLVNGIMVISRRAHAAILLLLVLLMMFDKAEARRADRYKWIGRQRVGMERFNHRCLKRLAVASSVTHNSCPRIGCLLLLRRRQR